MSTASWQATVLTLFFIGLTVTMVLAARRGRAISIRRINGMEAIDEAVGRAAELGVPVLFNPGIDKFTNIQTLAALGILDHVCHIAAKFDVPVLVTTNQPVMVPTCEAVMKGAFEAQGHPDLIQQCQIRFVSPANDQTALGTAQLMADARVASCFLFGPYDYTSLLYSEGGQLAGCMQIAGTADYYQIPFFIASCDYVVIGEELFACSAYLSKEPTMLGSIAAQDIGKGLLLLMMLAGIAAATLYGDGNPLNWIGRILEF